MSYNLVDPTTGDLTRVAGGNNINDATTSTSTTWSSKKINDSLGGKVDYKVVVENGTRYVEDIVVQDINTWLPNDNSSIVINLKKMNNINYSNFQLLCNKQDSKNWTCIVIGNVSTFWRICYVNGVRYIEKIATESDLNSKGVFKGYIGPNKKLTINMEPYGEVYGYVQVQGSASTPFRLHNAASNATPTVFLKRSVTINEENVYVDKPFGTTVIINSVTITNTNGVWTITNPSTETESYWVGGGVNGVSLSDV